MGELYVSEHWQKHLSAQSCQNWLWKREKKENPIKKKRKWFVFSRCFRASTFLVLGLSTINFAQWSVMQNDLFWLVLEFSCDSFTSRFRCKMISFDLLISITIDAKWPYFGFDLFWHWFLIANLIARLISKEFVATGIAVVSHLFVLFVCLFRGQAKQTAHLKLSMLYHVEEATRLSYACNFVFRFPFCSSDH